MQINRSKGLYHMHYVDSNNICHNFTENVEIFVDNSRSNDFIEKNNVFLFEMNVYEYINESK